MRKNILLVLMFFITINLVGCFKSNIKEEDVKKEIENQLQLENIEYEYKEFGDLNFEYWIRAFAEENVSLRYEDFNSGGSYEMNEGIIFYLEINDDDTLAQMEEAYSKFEYDHPMCYKDSFAVYVQEGDFSKLVEELCDNL